MNLEKAVNHGGHGEKRKSFSGECEGGPETLVFAVPAVFAVVKQRP
ncbi:MAG: hypothetical protein QM739_07760 [Propionivibrio sp.]